MIGDGKKAAGLGIQTVEKKKKIIMVCCISAHHEIFLSWKLFFANPGGGIGVGWNGVQAEASLLGGVNFGPDFCPPSQYSL